MPSTRWEWDDYHHVLTPARTIADLAGCERLAAAHLAEALQYRTTEGP